MRRDRAARVLGSLTRWPELNLLNVLKRDEARYPVLCVHNHKGRDGRINFLRNRRKVNEVRMIDGKTTARAGNNNNRRERIRPDNICNLFSGHKREIRRKLANSKHIILLLWSIRPLHSGDDTNRFRSAYSYPAPPTDSFSPRTIPNPKK